MSGLPEVPDGQHPRMRRGVVEVSGSEDEVAGVLRALRRLEDLPQTTDERAYPTVRVRAAISGP